MMNGPRTRNPFRVAVSGAVLLVLFSFMVLATVPENSSADSFPKTISGHVFEGDHSHPVADAHVIVKTKDSGGNTRQTLEFDTDSNGFYYVSTSDDWALVFKIEVTASYDSTQKTVEVDDNDGPLQNIEVPFPYAIPQLVGIGGAMIAVSILGVVAIVNLRKKPIQT